MQFEIWITVLVGIICIVITIIITWIGTRKTIKDVAGIVSKHIGEAIRAIHEDIKASQAKIERKLKAKS
jgi:uncharacterized protein YneF (UPF0154 family)